MSGTLICTFGSHEDCVYAHCECNCHVARSLITSEIDKEVERNPGIVFLGLCLNENHVPSHWAVPEDDEHCEVLTYLPALVGFTEKDSEPVAVYSEDKIIETLLRNSYNNDMDYASNLLEARQYYEYNIVSSQGPKYPVFVRELSQCIL